MYAQHGYLPWKNQYPDVEKRFDWDYDQYHYGHDQIVQLNRNYIDALRVFICLIIINCTV